MKKQKKQVHSHPRWTKGAIRDAWIERKRKFVESIFRAEVVGHKKEDHA